MKASKCQEPRLSARLTRCRHCGLGRVHAVQQEAWSKNLERLQMNAVDRAVNIVNGVIKATARSTTEKGSGASAADTLEELMRTELASASSNKPGDNGKLEEEVKNRRPVKLACKVSVSRKLTEVPGRSLKEYLALPVEEYSLLDESTVTYLGNNRFRLSFPFKEWFKLDLAPELILNIRPQPEHCRVLFVCESLKFGHTVLDNTLNVSFATAVSRESIAATKIYSGQPSHDVYLVSAANLKSTLHLPGKGQRLLPVSVLEKVLNQLLKAVLQATMKPYVVELENDYQNWAKGLKRTTSKLRPEVMNAALLVSAEVAPQAQDNQQS